MNSFYEKSIIDFHISIFKSFNILSFWFHNRCSLIRAKKFTTFGWWRDKTFRKHDMTHALFIRTFLLWWRHRVEIFSAACYWSFVWEFTGHRWISLTKASDAELWCFLRCAPERTVGYTIETPLIWDAIAFIMTSLYCNTGIFLSPLGVLYIRLKTQPLVNITPSFIWSQDHSWSIITWLYVY